MENMNHKNATEKNGSNRRGGFFRNAETVWQWAEVALFLFGIALLIFYGVAHIDRYLTSRAALKSAIQTFERLDAPPAAGGAQPVKEELAAGEPDFAGWDAKRIEAYNGTLWKRTGTPLAILDIPRLHLAAPVLDGADALTLNHAVGRIAGTARPGEPGKIGIAGHRDSFFRGLKDIAEGDRLELRTRSGKDIYLVDRIQIVSPSDVSVLRTEPVSALTLVTCYPFYYAGSAPKRFVVTAYLVEQVPAGATTSELRLDSQPVNTAPHNTLMEEQ